MIARTRTPLIVMTQGEVEYRLYAEMTTFWKARLRCADEGGKLATISSKKKHDFIHKNFVRSTAAGSLMEVSPPDPGFSLNSIYFTFPQINAVNCITAIAARYFVKIIANVQS